MMVNPEWIGGAAAFLTTSAYIPQAVRVLRTRETHSISLGMYVLVSIGLAFWMVYGIALGSPSLIAANGITLIFALVILMTKLRFG